jgi:peptide/nickel transport system permease protein
MMAVAEPARQPPSLRLPRLTLGRADRTDLAGIVVLLLVSLVAVAAPWLAPHGSNVSLPLGPFHAPVAAAPLGTDDLGRDVLSRVIYGIRASWLSALVVIVSGVLIGGAVGLVAGTTGGFFDALLMRTTDLFLALPGPLLALAVVAVLGPSLRNTLIAVGVVWWPWYARVVRSEVRSLAARPHLDAARLAGAGHVRQALRHLLPGTLAAVLVTASLDVGNLVLTLAGLSFLGLGAPPPAPELGSMAARGLPYLLLHWWIPVFPALAVFVLAFAANLAGDALKDLFALDVR